MNELLHEWETFYVIVGSAAAALTGLQFVVIALNVSGRTIAGAEEAVAAFATPNIVHFSSVLMLAALISIPRESASTLSICLTIAGICGVAYTVVTALRARRQSNYEPVLEDWLWHVAFPFAAYLTLLISGAAMWRFSVGALYGVAVVALLLLLIGIHNAWDSAVYIATQRSGDG